MPRLDQEVLGQPYECMLLPATGLDTITPDPRTFADKFVAQPDASVVVFDNLGCDAVLVAPRPDGPAAAYGHIAAFVRAAPREQGHALLRAVAEMAVKMLARRTLWISTAGFGVAWLHIRLDMRPKYYACRRYRAAQ